MKDISRTIGKWAFIVGSFLALSGNTITAYFAIPLIPILFFVGLVIGFLNITEREVQTLGVFTSVTLAIAFGYDFTMIIGEIGTIINGVFDNFALMLLGIIIPALIRFARGKLSKR